MTRGEIAQVALELVDRVGVDKFSMRLLADALGVATMAVYHHFQNKSEILQAAADQVWIEVARSVPAIDDPVERLIQSMLVVRRVFMRHPDLAPYALASPGPEDAVHVAASGVVLMFEAAGFRDEAVGRAYHLLATHTLGSTLHYAARTRLDRAIRAPVSDLATIAPADLAAPPETSVAYRAVREAMGDDPDLTRFERGLRELTDLLLRRYVDPA